MNELRHNLSTTKKAALLKRPHPRAIAITQATADSSFNHENTAVALASIVGSGATSTAAGESFGSRKNSLRLKKSQRLRDTVANSKERSIKYQEGLNISRIGGLGLPGMVDRSSKRHAGEQEGASVLTGMDEAAMTQSQTTSGAYIVVDTSNHPSGGFSS